MASPELTLELPQSCEPQVAVKPELKLENVPCCARNANIPFGFVKLTRYDLPDSNSVMGSFKWLRATIVAAVLLATVLPMIVLPTASRVELSLAHGI
jgi:hypothetical protein